ncbi:hypothetical protein BG000_003695 [Podila horticola]|nr:hypothetical protein BG000_003695 [Podila horticola]
MTSPDIKTLEIQTRISTTTSDGKGEETDRARVLDPILDNLLHGESFRQGKKMWSAVALDFTNRRRNKFNGVVYPEDILKADPATGEIHVRLTVEQSIGNCPKYITIREMAPLKNLVSSSTISQELFHYGNIVADPRVGLLFVDFDTGDCLHVTGTAKIFVGHESQALYPHSQRAVQVSIESIILNRHALPFRLITKELSPYNPRTATLAAGTMLHDGTIRTWTISSASERPDKATERFSLTIKHKAGGQISTLLHEWAPEGDKEKGKVRRLTVPLMSIGGEFVLPTESKKLLFISGGIGATPFIAMLRGLGKQKEQGEEDALGYDIRWITSATVVEESLPEILQEVLKSVGAQLSINVFLTRTSPDSLSSAVLSKLSSDIVVETGRLDAGRLHDVVPDVLTRQVLLCGPDPFMEATRGYLKELHVAPENIHSEEFNF